MEAARTPLASAIELLILSALITPASDAVEQAAEHVAFIAAR